MKVWFMRDNHTFVFVGAGSNQRHELEAKAGVLFSKNPYGHLFARDSRDREIASLGGSASNRGMLVLGLKRFFDKVDEYSNWEARG